jgi:hypothetical protein
MDGSKKPIHVRIYKPINGPAELHAIKTDVNEGTNLEWFQ